MSKVDKNNSALKVNEGIEQPPSVNKEAAKRFAKRRIPKLSPEKLVEGITQGNRTFLSKAITLIESSHPKHQEEARELIRRCLPLAGKSIRIGITGVPGVGKSTFIEAFGKHLTNRGHKVAILAIDPSSNVRKGSILGDKTRMEELSTDLNAFIRPSPSAGTLGGVAQKTRESICLCEAAGFDVIIVETVGVGQSETSVHSMVDFFLLLMLAGAGDELQGIKRGIMEMADAIIINKADGDNIRKAKLAKAEYQNALHLFPPAESGWSPQVLTCSSVKKDGIDVIWDMINDYKSHTTKNGFFESRRSDQKIQIMFESLEEQLKELFYNNSEVRSKLPILREQLVQNKIDSYFAANKLISIYNNTHK